MTIYLSIQNLYQRGYGIKYDNEAEDAFLFKKPNGETIAFEQSEEGLSLFDTRNEAGINLLNTIEDKKSKYLARQIKRADEVRATYYKIGLPSVRDYKNIVR